MLTAATGMDALSALHRDASLAACYNPPADAIALDGAGPHLVGAVARGADGQDREARNDMMIAAMEGALAFQKGLGAVHALSHALGGLRASASTTAP